MIQDQIITLVWITVKIVIILVLLFVAVAYVTGLAMRRAAELYAGAAKTDPRDAWVLADFATRNADRLTWLEVGDELLVRLRVLNGRDTDLGADTNWVINRCRDALVAVSPGLERAVGHRLGQAGVRDALRRWSTPTALRAAGETRIRNAIKERSPRLAAKVTDGIWDALEAQSVTLPAEDTWGEVIADLLGDLERIATRRHQLAKTIEEVFLSHPLGAVLVTHRTSSQPSDRLGPAVSRCSASHRPQDGTSPGTSGGDLRACSRELHGVPSGRHDVLVEAPTPASCRRFVRG